MKTWRRKYEWTAYAACVDSTLHTAEYFAPELDNSGLDTPAFELSDRDLESAAEVCRVCRVRPECIEWAVREKACSVVVAGTYLPDPIFKRELRVAYHKLQKSLPAEREKRGDV